MAQKNTNFDIETDNFVQNNYEYTLHPDDEAGNALKPSSNKFYKTPPNNKCRFLSKQGRYQVKRKGRINKRQRYVNDIFTTFVDMRWRWTLLTFASFFIISWLLFTLIYMLIEYCYFNSFVVNHVNSGKKFHLGRHQFPLTSSDYNDYVANHTCIDAINNDLNPDDVFQNETSFFISVFLFSLESQTTIGYGSRAITSNCAPAIIVLIIQSVIGCLIDAFTAGYIIAKFTRPKKRVATLLFSKEAVIARRDGKLCFMFRVGNLRKSLLVEANIRMIYIADRDTEENETVPMEQQRMNLDLGGMTEKILLVTPQVVCHPIDPASPLYRLCKEDLDYYEAEANNENIKVSKEIHERFEIIVILEGQVESTGMTMQARVSYTPEEIKWGHRFTNILEPGKERRGYQVNFHNFHDIEQPNPLCEKWSAAEIDQKINKRKERHNPKGGGDANTNNNNLRNRKVSIDKTALSDEKKTIFETKYE